MDKKLASFLLRKLYHVYSERKIGYEFRTISIFYEIMYILVKDYRVTAHQGEGYPTQPAVWMHCQKSPHICVSITGRN